VYAEIDKIAEDGRRARYAFRDGAGSERVLILDKIGGTVGPEDGVHDILTKAVARKVAVRWAETGSAPERLMVAS
jgi:hypothetical protein